MRAKTDLVLATPEIKLFQTFSKSVLKVFSWFKLVVGLSLGHSNAIKQHDMAKVLELSIISGWVVQYLILHLLAAQGSIPFKVCQRRVLQTQEGTEEQPCIEIYRDVPLPLPQR